MKAEMRTMWEKGGRESVIEREGTVGEVKNINEG